jgi:outer membrane protein, multidrug efflux system
VPLRAWPHLRQFTGDYNEINRDFHALPRSNRRIAATARLSAMLGLGVLITTGAGAQGSDSETKVAPATKVEVVGSSANPTMSTATVASTAAPADPMLEPMAPTERSLASWAEAVNLIKARSLDLRIAVLDVTKAEAQSRTALAGVLPSLNASANYNHQLIQRTTTQTSLDAAGNRINRASTNPTPDAASANLSLSVPIVNAPAWYAIGTAAVSEEIARLSVEDLKRRLTIGIASAIVGVVTAERVAELNRNGLANALTRQALAASKFRNGVATALDLERANQDVISTRTSVLNGDEALRQAREALGLALGFADPVGVRPDLSLDGLLNDTRSTCRALGSLQQRADMAVLEKKRELSARQITSVKLQFAPTLSLASGLGTTTPKSAMAPPATWNIQAVLNWSVWDGGARYGALRSARAAAEQADASRDALGRSATIDIRQARRAVAVATQAVAVSTQARDAAVQIDDMTQKMFRAGMSTSLELVVAATARRQAEINLATQQFALVQTQITAAMSLASCPW